jgi:hypothetical protein
MLSAQTHESVPGDLSNSGAERPPCSPLNSLVGYRATDTGQPIAGILYQTGPARSIRDMPALAKKRSTGR